MHDLRIFFLLLALLLAVSCANDKQNAEEVKEELRLASEGGKLLTGNVVGISDGDTFRLLTGEYKTIRVRLHGVDAPEKGQDYGTQARQALSNLVFSKAVQVVQKSKDRYGRTIAIVFVNGTNVNEELLRQGLVWHYTEYDKNPQWAGLQAEARRQQKGLWNSQRPTPPWQWRKAKRTESIEAD